MLTVMLKTSDFASLLSLLLSATSFGNQWRIPTVSRIAIAGGDQLFDGFDGGDAAAGSGCGAVEGGGGAGEVEPALEGPAIEQSVDEAGVEDVSCAGGVDGVHAISRCVEELPAVPGEYALFSERRGGENATV